MSPTKIKNQKSRGVSLILVVLVMSVILAIGLGISGILNQRTEAMRGIGYSVIALYAADTGIERVLIEANPKSLDGFEEQLNNEARYKLIVKNGGEADCDPQKTFCIKSIGSYKEVKRAIEIKY